MKKLKKCNIGVLETCLLGYIPTCGEKDSWLLDEVCVVLMSVMLSSLDFGGLFAKNPFEGRISYWSVPYTKLWISALAANPSENFEKA